MSPDNSGDSWDAMTAAPAYHTVLLENADVRVLETRVAPGQTVPLHAHGWPAVQHILSWSDFLRRDVDGTVVLDTRVLKAPAAGTISWSAPLPLHSLENVGDAVLHVISVEVKDSRSLPDPAMRGQVVE